MELQRIPSGGVVDSACPADNDTMDRGFYAELLHLTGPRERPARGRLRLPRLPPRRPWREPCPSKR